MDIDEFNARGNSMACNPSRGGGGGEMGEVIRDKLQPDGPRGSYADFTLHS